MIAGRHGYAVGCGLGAAIVCSTPAIHSPTYGRAGGKGDNLPLHILTRAAARRIGGSCHRVGAAAGVAERQGEAGRWYR